MSATAEQEPRTPPRLLVRTFWLAQRAIYRLSSGRLGLARPEASRSFGMLRLETIGRRSGRPRAAIVGYYEDGSNLVTLAMNGWGKAEPAWWLNLQAQPEATVRLVDGARAVRARVATAGERQRLWAGFSSYPGWGGDIDALAARRPRQSAVVVLEPRAAAEEADERPTEGPRAAPTAAPGALDVHPDDGAATRMAAVQVARQPRRLAVRHLWLIPGIGLALFANQQSAQLGVGLIPLLLFGIAPDLPRLVGLRRCAVRRLYNAMHHPVVPLALLAGSAATGISPFAYVGALAWLGHVVVGWGTGDQIRAAVESAGVTTRSERPGHLTFAPEAAPSS